MLKHRNYSAGEGKYLVNLLATITAEGLIVQVLGGDKPHVGAVALSVPRPGLSDPDKVSCNTTVVPLLGHKDDEVAKPVAEKISRVLATPVAVVAGLHIDNASEAEIALLLHNCWEATAQFLKEAKEPSLRF